MSTSENANPARSFYDRISHAYDMIADSNEHTAREAGLKMLAVQAGETVLEVGYGTGHSLVQLATAAGESGRVVGVDISDGMKKVSEKTVAAGGVGDRVQLDVGEVPPLSYEDAMFDAVSMSFTLELFPLDVIPEVLNEVRRVLKPGGRFATVSMATTLEGQSDSALEKTYKWMHQHFPHIVDCQPIDVVGLLEKSGFEIAERQEIEIWTMPVRAVVAKPA